MVTTLPNGYTEFRFYRPKASGVFLAGDFNEWRKDQLRMVNQGGGMWSIKLALPSGSYKFRYLADGSWFTDFASFGVEPSRFGFDSLVLVPPQKLPFYQAQAQTQSHTQSQPQGQTAAAAA
jgi:1,4-alpha-glucan branching enzyme